MTIPSPHVAPPLLNIDEHNFAIYLYLSCFKQSCYDFNTLFKENTDYEWGVLINLQRKYDKNNIEMISGTLLSSSQNTQNLKNDKLCTFSEIFGKNLSHQLIFLQGI